MPWWLPADAAELDILLWEFVSAAKAHERCGACHRRNHYCKPLEEAFEAILEWKRGRELLSKAVFLRRIEERRAA